ncbi:MAG: sugar phosphate isomerase/epimerase [Desulfomonile tiedjei]|uniref:Sugar phosphate isomerase/epimerase n=1 Tax=Desulfomonile tiedjei TaxID=2358 RepID=A0A9D6Z4K5_9BACT|nr:sugar phosphate isomerase/epimerase [Desulfomonile tiedjei]
MRLSFSTNAFVRFEIFEAVERIGQIGYQGVELLADAPHLYADSVTDHHLEKLLQILDKTGLKVANVNANTAMGFYGREFWEPLFEPSLANPDRELRRWRIAYSKKCIDMARVLGSPCISVTSGRPVPGVDPCKSMELLIESMAELLNYAENKSVRIGIEYEPGILIERYEELAAFMEKMGSSYLGANLDLGHSHVLGEDPETVISELSSRIFHVHLEDIRGGKHYHLIPGTGDMDFHKLFRSLTQNGYEGFATVELYTYPHEPDSAARQALSYLQHVWPTHE